MSQSGSDSPPAAADFNFIPLLLAYASCTMAMMAFVALIGPIARELGLPAWQAGAAVTIAGLLWVLLARAWGLASDRLGRRPILLTGLGGFLISYAALCAGLIWALSSRPEPGWVFLGLVLTRGAAGAFYSAIPTAGQALVADELPPAKRAGMMASLGAANGLGLVLGPALAGALAPFGLATPLYLTAFLPVVALVVMLRGLPQRRGPAAVVGQPARLGDRRLRRPMAIAFSAMFTVSIAQITVGFLAIDRLGLSPDAAARAAGLALTLVGVALILTQLIVRRLAWAPERLVRIGAVVSALGFGSVMGVDSVTQLGLAFFVSAAGMGAIFPAFAAMGANAVQAHEQGAAAGSVNTAQGFGVVLGPLAGTLLYEWGPGVPYGLAALLLLAVAFMMRGR